MDTRTVEQALADFRATLAERITVEELIVFGSYLEGTATEDSDLDVIVVSDDFEALSEDERLDILEEAVEASEPPIHPWGFTRSEMETASALTTLGYARASGLRFG
jgi:predicted nucleotidyltransferase